MPAQANPSKFENLPLSTSGPLECALTGTALLNHPSFNKGSAFTKEERRVFELTGLLPPSIQTLEQQVQRAYEQYSDRADDLAKNTFLTSVKEQNEVLFFKVRHGGDTGDKGSRSQHENRRARVCMAVDM